MVYICLCNIFQISNFAFDPQLFKTSIHYLLIFRISPATQGLFTSLAQYSHAICHVSAEGDKDRTGSPFSPSAPPGEGTLHFTGKQYTYIAVYIEVQGTTPNFCPQNLGIFISEMGQLQGLFGT